MAKASPNKVVKDTADCSAKRLDKYRKQKATETVKECQQQSKYMQIDDSAAARRA